MGNKSSSQKLSKEDLEFLTNNTRFSKGEIKEWYRGFMKDCPDGLLDMTKFLDVYSSFLPSGTPDTFGKHMFRSFDDDNSGNIDFKEFLQAINVISCKNPEEKLNWAFNMYDIDGNGSIDKEEMVQIISAIYSMMGHIMSGEDFDTPEERTEKIFKQIDENGDGVLTKSEFVEGCMKDKLLYQILTADMDRD